MPHPTLAAPETFRIPVSRCFRSPPQHAERMRINFAAFAFQN